MQVSFAEDQEAAARARAQDVALFRYRLIAPAIEPGLTGRQRGALVRQIAVTVHAGPAGRPVQVSRKSLDRWIRAYRAGGFEALCPSPRHVTPRTEAAVLELAAALKKENPARTAAQVARIIAAHGGWSPSERTLQRHFARQEIATPAGGVVHGRFEAEAPNLLWTGDVLHGPPVAGQKTYLFAFIDDHSRLVTGFRWGFSEDSLHLAEALKRAIAIRGVPARLYVDNGACFSDEALPRYCAKLGIALVHSPPYRPQGRGKIERWFETVRAQFLVEISPDGQPAPGRLVLAGLDELNGRFHTWTEQEYHQRAHSETGMTPLARWAPCQPRRCGGEELDAAFLWEATRSVHAATATIRFHGNVYEVDAQLAGQTVTLTYSPFDLAGAKVPIQVSHRGAGYGTARPHVIRRHAHPKVKTPPRPGQPPAEATGISYLDLLEQQRTAADGTAYSIRYHDLAGASAATPATTEGQPS
ncbi:MAG TPA: transposase [Actinobacteria bacterium]|nr:transposase [Actinomycetota bacterium]